MSDQPTPTLPPSSTKSLDDVLNQLEKGTGASSFSGGETQPMAPIPANQNPILSSNQTSVPTPEEPATFPETPPVTEVTPSVPETPAEPTPVATLSENPIAAPPPQERPEAAPMVKEEPIIDKQKAMEAPLPPAPPEETPTQVVTPKPSNKGKIIAGVIGILLLTGVAGVGVYFSRMQQNTQGAAYVPSTPLSTTRPSAAKTAPESTPVAINTEQKNYTGSVSGKVCTEIFNQDGEIDFYNTAKKKTYVKGVSKGVGTYQVNIPPGEYFVAYASTKNDLLGYTDATHSLQRLTLPAGGVSTNINICDPSMDANGIPAETYEIVKL